MHANTLLCCAHIFFQHMTNRPVYYTVWNQVFFEGERLPLMAYTKVNPPFVEAVPTTCW